MAGTDFDTPHIFEQEFEREFAAAPAPEPSEPPYEEENVPFQLRTDREKALALIGNKDKYRESPAQRTASLAFASLEQAAAVDRQTAAIERQTEIFAEQNALTIRTLAELRMANQLAFIAMRPEDFAPKHAVEPEQVAGQPVRESAHTQMKRNLGFIAVRPAIAAEPVNDFADGDDAIE